MIRDSKELQIGKTGEYLVCADLILKGFIAFPSEQGLPYDVILDNGYKLLRVQVKTTSGLRKIPQRNKDSYAYIFNTKRAGNNGRTRYNKDEIDLFALVCLDTMQVGYIKNKDMPETINIRADSLKGTYYDEKGISDCNTARKLLKSGMSQTEVSKKMGIHVSIINRYAKEDYIPYKTKARYFSELIRNSDWFI